MNNMLNVSSSPHIRHEDTTSGIMLDVIIALLPAAIAGCMLFGLYAAAIICTCVISAVLFEFLWNIILKKPQSVGDFSAVVTGLLLGMNLPPKTPLWVAAIGSFAAIIVVKQMFGGLGFNFVNPAIAARIILLVSFPQFLAGAKNYIEPLSHKVLGEPDTITMATPLDAMKNAISSPDQLSIRELFLGSKAGSIGEVSAMLLILGGLYLIIRKVIKPIIPVAFIGTIAILTYLFKGFDFHTTIVYVLSGGLILGAIFMATDYVTSPTTDIGKLIFGIGCGLITFVIRQWGSLPEGVSYSIILMNILVPHINRLTARKPFGLKGVKTDGK
ncbi:MAG: RnfABCDGE type electron transport complex subunit D [Clostridia bacterium]|nr:RnfABCDGE type electron transport complex subunit D [Clostridia bacterium]